MDNFDIKDTDIVGSDLSETIYNEHSALQEEKKAFESFIKDIYYQQFDNVKRSSRRQRDYSKKSNHHQNLIREKFQQIYSYSAEETPTPQTGDRVEKDKGLSIFNPFEEFIEEIIEKSEDKLVDCIRDSEIKYSLQGLDDTFIELDKLKVYKNRIAYDKIHNNISTITFLISGYMTQDIDAKENFSTFVNDKDKSNSPNSLFVNFRWSSSSPVQIIKSFFADLGERYIEGKSDNNQLIINFCENYLSNIMKNSDLNPVFKNVIYFIIRSLLLFINTPVLSGFCKLILELFLDLLNSIIKNFQLGYDMAKKSGKILSNIIKDLSNQFSSNSLNIDLMGHSLGTVVIQSSLVNIESQKLIRFVILMGGVTTIQEMMLCTPTFEKCLNYYSYNDQVLKQLVINGEIIGDHLQLAGLNPFSSSKGVYFDRMLTIGHTDYSKQYSEFHDIALQVFNRDQRVYKSSVDFSIIDTPQPSIDIAIYLTLSIPLITLSLYFTQKYFKN